MSVAEFKTGYLDKALDSLDVVLDRAVEVLAEVDYDTLVGTGFSGALVVPALALRLGKRFILVRKEYDGSHHSGRLIGNLGERWVFVDDFVASGRTKDRVLETITRGCEPTYFREEEHRTTYVGDYLYAWDGKFCPA